MTKERRTGGRERKENRKRREEGKEQRGCKNEKIMEWKIKINRMQKIPNAGKSDQCGGRQKTTYWSKSGPAAALILPAFYEDAVIRAGMQRAAAREGQQDKEAKYKIQNTTEMVAW